MSKKKEGSKKSKEPPSKKNLPVKEDPEPWINELKTLTINDDNWRCNVSLIVERNSSSMDYIMSSNNIFNSSHKRPFIKIVSDSTLVTKIMEMNYGVNTSVLNGYRKLCELAIKYCSSEGLSQDMPAPITASIIKYYIYYLKLKSLNEAKIVEEYQKKKQKLKDDSMLTINSFIPSRVVTSKDKSKKGTKSATKKSAKEEQRFTELRKRGEEILDTLMMNADKPEDGPQLYIVINLLRQEELPSELLKLQVPLTVVIKLHNLCWPENNNTIDENVNKRICHGLQLLCKSMSFKQRRFSSISKQNLTEDIALSNFWERFYKILNDKANVLTFKDTIFLKFYPKLYINLPLKENSSVYEDIQESLYNQLCYLQYDVEDVKRQHQNFLHHLIDRNVDEERRFHLEDMSVYISAVEEVPPEVLNIPFIFDCMLRQIEYCVDSKASIIPELEESDNLEAVESANLEEVESASKDNMTAYDFETILQDLDLLHDLFTGKDVVQDEPVVLPSVLVHGDEVGIQTCKLDCSKLVKDVTCGMLKCFWEKLFSLHLPTYDDLSMTELKSRTHLFDVLTTTGDVTPRDKLCNLPCTFGDTSSIVEDKAYVFCLFDSENGSDVAGTRDLSCRYHCNDIDEEKMVHYTDPGEGHWVGQVYDKHSYCFEEMTSDILLQNLFNSVCNLNCFDMLQDYFNNRIFIKFHHRKTCQNKEYQMGVLKTKTAIRDFYDYTIDEEFFWLNEEELLYDKINNNKELKKQMSLLNKLEYMKKIKIYMTERICSDTNFTKRKGDDSRTDSLPKVPSYVQDEIQQTFGSSIIETGPLESFNIDLPNRVQFSESKQEFIVSINSQLQVKKLSRLYKDDAVFLLNTIHGHTLYFYQPVNGKINTDFHLIHKSEIIFDFKKSIINRKKETIQSIDVKHTEKQFDDVKHTEKQFDASNFAEVSDIFMKPLLYELYVSLPNTLCMEFVNPNNCPLYIKQHFLKNKFLPSELQDENCRCYLTDGKIMKFMNNESIIIYYPTSEIFECDILQPSETSETIVNKIVQQLPNQKQNKVVVEPELDVPLHEIGPETTFRIFKSYNYTSADGKRYVCSKEQEMPLETVFSISYSDLFNGVIVTKRSDGTILTHNKEGTLFVEFPDGSRITTTASFASDEILLDDGIHETNENYTEEFDKCSSNELDMRSVESGETNEGAYEEYDCKRSPSKPVAFTVINIQHYFEHLHFNSVFIDLNKETVSIDLPYNVKISFNSEGLYTINFDGEAEFLTEYNNIIFREINQDKLPQFNINLSNNVKEETQLNSQSDNQFVPLLSCKDSRGNELIISNNGDIQENVRDENASICKCDAVNKDRFFISDSTDYSGLEMYPPEILDLCNENSKNCVVQNYGSINHQVTMILNSKIQTAKEKWLIPPKENKELPMYELPSTYNDKNAFFPFPKRTKVDFQIKSIPSVLLVRAINRVNCNIYLDTDDFLKNKKIADILRIYKQPEMALEIFERNNVPFCKADKDFIKYVKDCLITSLITRVRRRVVKQLEMRKIKEYTNILVHKLLRPYFDNSRGAVFTIIRDLLLIVVQLSTLERNKLETLFVKPLNHLTDEDLDYIHNRISPVTVSNFCSCAQNDEFCQLRILLLAGRTLHRLFPDMISVLHAYGRNIKLKKETRRKRKEMQQIYLLLSKPSDTLDEDDLVMLHDALTKLPNVRLCSCHKNINHCKLRTILLACVTLSFIFPDVTSVLKLYGIEIDEKYISTHYNTQ